MSVEEILIAEYGKGKVSIEKAKKSKDGTMDVRIISRDGRREFKAQAVISDGYIEIAGELYSVEDFISSLNNAFEKSRNTQ